MLVFGCDGGVVFKVYVFVVVFGVLNYIYVCVMCFEVMFDWIGSLIDVLEFYGGVFELLVFDNFKVLIVKVDWYELVLGNMM